jgi:hypothetical protein
MERRPLREKGVRKVMRCLIVPMLFVSLAGASQPGRWISLFDGKTLEGWRPEGNAAWSVRDGAIVGRQGPNNSTGDLYTKGEWADFELECEFKVVWPANSGIWFRRNAAQPGYQADILDQKDQPNTYSGSLYAMNTGFIATNSDPKSVKKDGWNKLRMSAVGQEIVVMLNGRTVVKIRDNRFLKPGSIGIQVHPGKVFEPMRIEVRKIRLRPVSNPVTQ